MLPGSEAVKSSGTHSTSIRQVLAQGHLCSMSRARKLSLFEQIRWSPNLMPIDSQRTNLDARIDRVIRGCLQEEPRDERIMFNFRTLDEFRAFIKKVLVTGNVQNV
jgi:hypothetical protein